MFFNQNLERVYNTLKEDMIEMCFMHYSAILINSGFFSSLIWLYLHMEALEIKHSLKWDPASFILRHRQPTTGSKTCF